MNGGTFTLSNLGMYGVSQFAAIVNPPQVWWGASPCLRGDRLSLV